MPRKDPIARAAYAKKHYLENKAQYVARALAHNVKMRDRARIAVLRHLAKHPCVDCGERDPIVLEFDHRPGVEKCFEIGSAVVQGNGISLERLLKEIAKCDVRCANCHRRKTARELGWFRALVCLDGDEGRQTEFF